nr:HAD family acid phosphatase [Legionella sp. km772]
MIVRNVFVIIISLFSFATFAEPLNNSLLKKEIRQYHDSGEYEKELAQKILQAQAFLIQQVQYHKEHKSTKKLALVLDIDETSITNYDKIAKRDFAANLEQIHQEILAADSPALKPTLALYNTALKNGVAVFFVTGRFNSELAATKKNLNDAGYNNWTGIYVRPDDYKQQSIIAFKANSRKKIEDQGYLVVASIGDQYSDIKGGYALKGFKLPNPFYYIP